MLRFSKLELQRKLSIRLEQMKLKDEDRAFCDYKSEILKTIKESHVTLISAPTGSGKVRTSKARIVIRKIYSYS